MVDSSSQCQDLRAGEARAWIRGTRFLNSSVASRRMEATSATAGDSSAKVFISL